MRRLFPYTETQIFLKIIKKIEINAAESVVYR